MRTVQLLWLRLQLKTYRFFLLALGALSFTLISSCGSNSTLDKDAGNDDSIRAAEKADSLKKLDSLAQVERDQEVKDSVRRADSVARLQVIHDNYINQHQATKYGVRSDINKK